MSLFDFSILDMLPKVVADGSEGGVNLYTEVAPKSNGCFIYRTFLFRKEKQVNRCFSHLWAIIEFYPLTVKMQNVFTSSLAFSDLVSGSSVAFCLL